MRNGLGERGKAIVREYPAIELLHKYDRREAEFMLGVVEDAATFNRTYGRQHALEVDRKVGEDHDYFDWDMAREGCKYRFFSLPIPKAMGGLAGKYMITTFGLATEEWCSNCPGMAMTFAAHALGAAPLVTSGAVAHWNTIFHEMMDEEARGNPVMMAYAITEPSAGTDVEDPKFLAKGKIGMEAKKVKGGYVINGRKVFISGGREAKYITLTAATDRKRPLETWTTFLIERDMKGFSTPRVERKMGQRANHATELLFEDVFVPDSHVCGYEGDGMANGILMIMAASRGPVGAVATGIISGTYEHFLNWARTKTNGIRPIDRESIQMTLADMKSALQQSRALYIHHTLACDAVFGRVLTHPALYAAFKVPRGLRASAPVANMLNSRYGKGAINAVFRYFVKDEKMTYILALASLAKYSCADAAMAVTSRALELMGPDPGEERQWVEKFFRDAKLTQIYEGTNQLNRLAYFDAEISKELVLEVPRPFKKGV